MKLSQGSLYNCLADNTAQKQMPKVGDGSTIFSWTDRCAATVIGVRKTAGGKLVDTVQLDLPKRVDTNGMCESQKYTFTPNPEGQIDIFKEKKDGVLRNNCSQTLHVGHRDEYYDFSF